MGSGCVARSSQILKDRLVARAQPEPKLSCRMMQRISHSGHLRFSDLPETPGGILSPGEEPTAD